MTPERKEYLNRCSKEEAIIRHEIKVKEVAIKITKMEINDHRRQIHLPWEWVGRNRKISNNRVIIKALRKQIPHKPWKFTLGYRTYYGCLNCGRKVCDDVSMLVDSSYCPWCGQKLEVKQ